jgi:hypothetical protein
MELLRVNVYVCLSEAAAGWVTRLVISCNEETTRVPEVVPLVMDTFSFFLVVC